jgi:hypothetical protein
MRKKSDESLSFKCLLSLLKLKRMSNIPASCLSTKTPSTREEEEEKLQSLNRLGRLAHSRKRQAAGEIEREFDYAE